MEEMEGRLIGRLDKMAGRLDDIEQAQESIRQDIQWLTGDKHRAKVVEKLGACFGASTLVDSVEKIIVPYLETPDASACALELYDAISSLLKEVAGTGTFLHIRFGGGLHFINIAPPVQRVFPFHAKLRQTVLSKVCLQQVCKPGNASLLMTRFHRLQHQALVRSSAFTLFLLGLCSHNSNDSMCGQLIS
jgi:hypothetical protein